MALLSLLLLLSFFFLSFASANTNTNRFNLDIHHRFSDRVRHWSESTSRGLPGGWPEKLTADYYAALVRHDRGRFLAEKKEVTFADGNDTARFDNLGSLHYAVVSLGTPNVTFLVALDTGSDLFWVPCECKSCAPTKAGDNGFNVDFSVYSPKLSSTSQRVPCNSSYCELQEMCPQASSQCPYIVQYVSANTSSSGFLVEDLLYLTTEDSSPKIVTAPIVFGCGQVQTGSFLDGPAPNGLFGLGMDKTSVPSTLANLGVTSNSFSMCFGPNGNGRISFGDSGSSDQDETPFNMKHSHVTYNISLAGINVGNNSMNVGFDALVDSGTSFTILAEPAYSSLTKSFSAEVHDQRYTRDLGIPFEYCYQISSIENLTIPDTSFTTRGGSQFPVISPIVIIVIKEQRLQQFIYCLAVVNVKGIQLNIIGQNFLTGLRLVFDRERMVLGWKKFNCYDAEDSKPLPVNPQNNSPAPSPSNALGPSSSTPEVTKENGNNGPEVKAFTPGTSNHSSREHLFASTILVLLLLSLAII